MTESSKQQRTTELGATGTVFGRNFLKTDEYVPKLQGRKGIDTISKMRRDGMVHASNQVVKLPIKAAKWTIQSDDDQAKEDLTEALFHRLNFKGNLLDHILLAFDYGHEVMEKVWEEDNGKLWYKKLGHRGQATIHDWVPDKDGNLGGIVQRAWKDGTYKKIEIPADKLFHIAYGQIGNNFVGESGYRAAYKYWWMKETFEKLMAIGLQRHAVGVPHITAPEGSYDPKDKDAAMEMMKAMTVGAQARMFSPHGWGFKIEGHGDSGRYDPLGPIHYCDEMIAMCVLAMALNLGRTQTGSRALGESMFDMFLLSLEAIADWIRAAINEQLIKPFLLLNHPRPDDVVATVEWSDLEIQNLELVSRALERLERGGFVTPDDDLEVHLRDLADVPQKVGKTSDKASRPPAETIQVHRPHRHDHPQMAGSVDFWRDLTGLEKSMSLREIAGKQDDGTEEVVEIAGVAKGKWVDALVEQVAEALSDGDASDVNDVQLSKAQRHQHAKELVGVMREMFVFGRRTVKDEAKKQKKKAASVSDGHDSPQTFREEDLVNEEITDLFWTRARKSLEQLYGRVKALVTERALDLWRTQRADFDEAELEEIAEEVKAMFEPAQRREGVLLVATAFAMGRNKEAEAQKAVIERAIYSAILDGDVCDECEPLDGEEFEVGSPDYYASLPPNRRCLSANSGSNNCRCLYVYEFSQGE
jgi:hypothetical protein